MAKSLLEIGFMISFAGQYPIQKGRKSSRVARSIPTDRLLIETDCPYLTPVPFRGRRRTRRVVEVARCLAELHEVETWRWDAYDRELFAPSSILIFRANGESPKPEDWKTGRSRIKLSPSACLMLCSRVGRMCV